MGLLMLLRSALAALRTRLNLEFPADAPVGLQRQLMADIRRIPHRFTGFDTTRKG